MQTWRLGFYRKDAIFKILIATLCFSITMPFVETATAATTMRSLVDRPDDVSGYQVHLVYVVPKGTVDEQYDTKGVIDDWVNEANNWLEQEIGHKLKFDTFNSQVDVTFLPSKYSKSELCFSCNPLEKLVGELKIQDPLLNASKTYGFFMSDTIAEEYLGFADKGNLFYVTAGIDSNSEDTKRIQGQYQAPQTLLHELFHTFGVGHVCFDKSDLMIGEVSCTTDGNVKTSIDKPRKYYLDGNLAGNDLLQMPIWSDGTGNIDYSKSRPISGNTFLPTLEGGTVYAIIGKKSESFYWEWDRTLMKTFMKTECKLSVSNRVIVGYETNGACKFDIPNSLRAGQRFEVLQEWSVGPWHGSASAIGTLAREDFTTTPCSAFTCYVGGSAAPHIACWDRNSKSINLQQLVKGKWTNIAKPPLIIGPICGNKFKYPKITLGYSKKGLYIYRWYLNDSKFADTPFAIIVNDENLAEPSQGEIAAAQTRAIELGKAADALKGTTPMKSTITCIKGKLTKKITGTNPKCPAGYK